MSVFLCSAWQLLICLIQYLGQSWLFFLNEAILSFLSPNSQVSGYRIWLMFTNREVKDSWSSQANFIMETLLWPKAPTVGICSAGLRSLHTAAMTSTPKAPCCPQPCWRQTHFWAGGRLGWFESKWSILSQNSGTKYYKQNHFILRKIGSFLFVCLFPYNY